MITMIWYFSALKTMRVLEQLSVLTGVREFNSSQFTKMNQTFQIQIIREMTV